MMNINKQPTLNIKAFSTLTCTALMLCLLSSNALAAEPEEELSERIDFGNSYIMGQTIKSGAVYLTHRKKSKIESMLKMREHYQEEILADFVVGEPVVIDDDKAQ